MRYAASSAARRAPAVLLRSSPSCLQSPRTPFFRTQRQPLRHRAWGPRPRGRGAARRSRGQGTWRAVGSSISRSVQSFSIRRGSWTRQKCCSPGPLVETESAACTSAVSLTPGELYYLNSRVFHTLSFKVHFLLVSSCPLSLFSDIYQI